MASPVHLLGERDANGETEERDRERAREQVREAERRDSERERTLLGVGSHIYLCKGLGGELASEGRRTMHAIIVCS